MVELEEIISNILTTQSETISKNLVKSINGLRELGLSEEDISHVSMGYGFSFEDQEYNVNVNLEKEEL